MLQLLSISLFQFKNYIRAGFTFHTRITGICGRNGTGKTNLLDAIHYLSFTKSYFSKNDAAQVHHGASGFRIEGLFEGGPLSAPASAVCILRETGKKEFSLDGVAYERFSRHIGRFPAVFIAPGDLQIITGNSEERRRFLDTLLCQLDADYLQRLMLYNKVLQQRNGYLKSLNGTVGTDNQLLDVYDGQLVDQGNYIFSKRREFMETLLPLLQDFYRRIAGTTESIGMAYESALLEIPFNQLLQQNRQRDCLVQRTGKGLHRDEISFMLLGQPFKSIASQGQLKSLLFALKLAEFEILKSNKGFPPLLLLDDVFEKLDQQRMDNLLHWVCVRNTGQVFITDTHRDRLETALVRLGEPFQLIEPGIPS